MSADTGAQVAAAARELVGVWFRAQGRDPAFGLDCVGVAAAALERAGVRVAAPDDYALRTAAWRGDPPAGLIACDGEAPGDVLLCRVSPAQVHVAVRTERGVVHADLALRRVVERPGTLSWPVIAAWRAAQAES